MGSVVPLVWVLILVIGFVLMWLGLHLRGALGWMVLLVGVLLVLCFTVLILT